MKRPIVVLALVLGLVIMGNPLSDTDGLAQTTGTYQLKITNLMPNQSLTPLLAATHTSAFSVFVAGTSATSGVKTMAEDGNVAPLSTTLNGNASVMQVATGSGLTTPAVTTTLNIVGGGSFNWVSIVAMLIPTNDTFVGARTTLPAAGELKVIYANAYDAGTEVNDQLCASIPGPNYPECGGPGTGGAPGNGEGAVVISNGIRDGLGDFGSNRDWKNPVVRVTIHKIS